MPKSTPKAPPQVAFGPEPVIEPAPPPVTVGEPEILRRLETPSRWSWALVAGGVVLAAGLSAFAVRGVMRKGRREG